MHDSDRSNPVAIIMQVAGLLDQINSIVGFVFAHYRSCRYHCRLSEKKSERGTEVSLCGDMQELIFNLLIVS